MSVGPCDIFSAAGTPCVAAHSLVRALYVNYTGSLYSVNRSSDHSVEEIGVTVNGFAYSAHQDEFCGQSTCTTQRIFDQSPMGNHLDIAPAGGNVPHGDNPVNASKHYLSVGGHAVYGAYFEGNMGYRNDKTVGIATGDDAETMYMVTNGQHYNGGCCFDYGNAEVDNLDDGKSTMEALYFGTGTHDWAKGAGDGPWIMADIEKGLYAGDKKGPWNQPSMTHTFVTAMLKGKPGQYGLKGGNAQEGSLQTLYEGKRPSGYTVMHKKGAIILGIGGDNSNRAIGTFYEGAMIAGYTSNSVDDALQANIVAARYAERLSPTPSRSVVV